MSSERGRFRRSHLKTRTGCQVCRSRKIKCDEGRPSCRNCIKHGAECDFSRASTALLATSKFRDESDDALSVTTLSPSPPGTFSVIDLELLHHFTTSTHLTLSSDPVLRNLCRVNIPQLGFQHQYVLLGLLSIASLHLGRYSPSKKDYYITQAILRHNASSTIALPILSSLNPDNAAPLYIFSILTCVFALARPQHSDFPVRQDVIPEWILLFRGAMSVVDMARESIRCSSLAAIVTPQGYPTANMEREAMTHEGLKELEATIHSRSASYSPQKLSELFQAIDALKGSFAVSSRGGFWEIRSVFKWVKCISDDYLMLLKNRDSEALCIFAFFSVILQRADSAWWIEGWGKYLIKRIYYLLDDVYRLWIRWPIEEIGWVPGH